MLNVALIVAAGPCLITAAGAIALFIVHSSLSRSASAAYWAASFATSFLRWAILAAAGDVGGAHDWPMVLFDLLGIVAGALTLQGFIARGAHARRLWLAPAFAVVGSGARLLALIIPGAFPDMLVAPIFSALLAAVAASMVVTPGRPRNSAELLMMLVLLTIVAIDSTATMVMLGAQVGMVGAGTVYFGLYALTLEPITGVRVLATLLLIAFDVSAELRRLIHTDPLTGALNREGLVHAGEAALRHARRRGRTLTLAIVDLDRFKGINDRYGHAAGDATLVGFTRLMGGLLAREEVVGRLGGEEFVLLLPGTSGAAALERLNATRASLGTLQVDGCPDLAVTASFGIAEADGSECLDALIERADAALYSSKRAGRDRCTLADDVSR